MTKKIIVRIQGGLGNQLFCYAAARRLALVNNAELVIDNVSGFLRDRCYHRRYNLNHFNIPVRIATPPERLVPFERCKRIVLKLVSRRRPFKDRCYVEQEGVDFDPRLLELKVNKTIYLDGLWQSEKYFKDIESTIREDLRFIPPDDYQNMRLSEHIRNCQSVALHIRWFDAPGYYGGHNASTNYYINAIEIIEKQINNPHYFIFSDQPDAAIEKLRLPNSPITCVTNNQDDQNAYADLWLMTQCRHVITANSTFSWWGAWLGEYENKIIICPGTKIISQPGTITAWNFAGQIPSDWIKL